MRPVAFAEQNVVFAKSQPQYRELPAHRAPDGRVFTCWRLSFWERVLVLLTGCMWVGTMTFNKALQPQLLSAHTPFERGFSPDTQEAA